MTDTELMQYYRVEFFGEWERSQKAGIIPSAKNLRSILGLDPKPSMINKFFNFFKS